MSESLRIRDMAARAGVTAHTLRYYERVGLLPRPERSASGYRVYRPEAVRRVRLVRLLRGLGFGVRELRGLAAVLEGGVPRAEARTRLRAKRDELGDQIRGLEASWKILDALQACRCRGDCTLVRRLLDGSDVS